jgi:hypothetical protein
MRLERAFDWPPPPPPPQPDPEPNRVTVENTQTADNGGKSPEKGTDKTKN